MDMIFQDGSDMGDALTELRDPAKYTDYLREVETARAQGVRLHINRTRDGL